jgi:GT2 family glycosyltransferase
MFEDDDYSMASQKLGYRNILAEDVFVHHYGSVSFSKLKGEVYGKLHRENQQYYEQKWDAKWIQPHFRPGE